MFVFVPPFFRLEKDLGLMVGYMTKSRKQPCLLGDVGKKTLTIGDWISSFVSSKVS